MLLRKNILSVNRKYMAGCLLLLFTAVISVAFSMAGSDNFDLARREVLLRRIGHELLLQSGDSTSRVMPVKKIDDNEYQLSFEHDLSFQPGLLVETTRRLLATDPLTRDYVVKVRNAADGTVTYGYAISKNKKDDIVSCRGRIQPRASYIIDISFKPTGLPIAKAGYVFAALALLALTGFVFWKPGNPQQPVAEQAQTGMLNIGSISFDPEARKLIINGATTELTKTETRLLSIFVSSPNEIIERSRLQKEIWDDEGVLVSRSLDMFISKLRKKLEADPNVSIVVVRGKGYKLEMNA